MLHENIYHQIYTSGNLRTPLRCNNHAAVSYDGFMGEPDNQIQVTGRLEDSPNAVIEVHFHDNESHQEVYDKAADYIRNGDDVLSVIVFTVWEAGAVFVYELRRILGTHNFTEHHHLSFGRRSMHPHAVAAMSAVFPEAVFRGVGFATVAPPAQDPLCDAANIPLYQMSLLSTHLFALDKDGNQMYIPPAGTLAAAYTIDLFEVQQYLEGRI